MKFQKNRYKTVGGVAPTRYPLSIHIVIDNARKWLSSTCEKSDKNNLRIISKPHAYIQTMTKAPVKFEKNWYKNCRRSCAHKVPTSIGGLTDGRKDGEAKTKSLCFSSKRRGTKISPCFNIYFSCQAAVKKVMSTCPGLNLVQSFLAVCQHWKILMSTCPGLNLVHHCKTVKASFSRSEAVF